MKTRKRKDVYKQKDSDELLLWNYIMHAIITLQNIKHLLDKTESIIQFIVSVQGNIGRSEADPNII